MLNPGSEEAEALAEVEEMEEVSKDMQEDIGRLVSKLEKRKAAAVSISDKARNWIAVAKEQSEEIVQEAEKKAESILAGAAEEIKRWEAEKAELAGVQDFQPIVNLNVGGVRVTTSLTTLNRFPDSMIGCMFSGRHTLPQGEDGYFFIDRDGTHFRHVLNFLRSPEGYKVSGLTDAEKEELRRECEYYGIDQLMFSATETEKTLVYRSLRGLQSGDIAVRVDTAGVHTIRDSGAKIEYCPHCDCGIFQGDDGRGGFSELRYYFAGFNAESPPAAQPRVQGACPFCHRGS